MVRSGTVKGMVYHGGEAYEPKADGHVALLIRNRAIHAGWYSLTFSTLGSPGSPVQVAAHS